jgi:hypothetical protein
MLKLLPFWFWCFCLFQGGRQFLGCLPENFGGPEKVGAGQKKQVFFCVIESKLVLPFSRGGFLSGFLVWKILDQVAGMVIFCGETYKSPLLPPWACGYSFSLSLTRVNSANVQDEGLRIRGIGRRMNLKVKIGQTRHVSRINMVVNLAYSQSVPGRPLLAPIYRWPGLKEPVGFDTYYSVCIRY